MSDLTKTSTELKWIEEVGQTSIKPELEEFGMHKQKTFSNTVLAKFKDNIFVPLGLVATTACLTLGLINMKKGNSRNQQLAMRGRVGFQAFTLVAMTVGMLLAQKNKRSKKT